MAINRSKQGPHVFVAWVISVNLKGLGIMSKAGGKIFVMFLDRWIWLYQYASRFHVTYCFSYSFYHNQRLAEKGGGY